MAVEQPSDPALKQYCLQQPGGEASGHVTKGPGIQAGEAGETRVCGERRKPATEAHGQRRRTLLGPEVRRGTRGISAHDMGDVHISEGAINAE
ncbi:hypothetical protein AOLI_G00029120 [Acnodon oligacanthus]